AMRRYWRTTPWKSASSGGARSFPYMRPAGGQVGGAFGRQNQAFLARHALSGNVEGGAVVDRHPHHRQAHGDVDAIVAIDRLEWRMALVVVAGDDELPLAPYRLREQRVGGDRPGGADA